MKKNICLSIAIIITTIVIALFMSLNLIEIKQEVVFSLDLTLKQLADKNDVPVKEILHILSHENYQVWNYSRRIPIKKLNIPPEKIKSAMEHIKAEANPIRDIIKYVLWAIWISIVLLLILSKKKINTIRTISLIGIVFIFGILLGSTPNPMESLVKVFKFLNNMEGEPQIIFGSFILFTLFSILGSKLICSWGCHLGALQESLFNIPIFKKKHTFKIPFMLSLAVRIILFFAFFSLLFGWGKGVAHGIKNFVIYHHINYFKIFSLDLALFALYTIPMLILLSLFIYRPFCQFICPFGLYAWFLQAFALNKIKIIDEKCTKCLKCVKDCPTEAMKDIYEKKKPFFQSDCWSCGICIEACPTNAIKYNSLKES